MNNINKPEKLFEMDLPAITLRQILSDPILKHSIPGPTWNYYMTLSRSNQEDIHVGGLLKTLEDIGLIIVENEDLNDSDGASSLVSRSLFINHNTNQSKFWCFNYMSSDETVSEFPAGTKCYLLTRGLPKARITKWKLLTITLLPLWRRYLVLLTFALLAASIGLIPTLAVEPIFSKIVPENRINDLIVIGIAVFVSQIVGAYLRGVSSFFGAILENDISLRSYIGVVDRFLSARVLSLPSRSVGSWDITFQTAVAFTSAVRSVLVDIPTSVFSIAMNFIVFGLISQNSSTLSLLLFLSLIPATANIAMSWISGRVSYKTVAINSQINQLLYKTVTSIGDLRALGQQTVINSDYADKRSELNELNLKMNALTQSGIFINSSLMAILTATILFLYSDADMTSQGGYLTIFIAFSAISGAFVDLAQSLSSVISSLPTYFSKNAIRDISEYRSYLGSPTQALSQKAANPLQTIELLAVDFKYQSTIPVIQNFSYLFEAGHSYALTGRPGCGKSSLLKLIGGLYLQNSGQILVNRIPNTPELNRLINYKVGFIPQQTKLLGDTIKDFMDPIGVYSKDEVYHSLESVFLADFVNQLPMGLETIISEFSNDFSTGQIQLLQAARMILSKPTLILSDEPTSHLDEHQHLTVLALLNQSCDMHISSLHKTSALDLFSKTIDIKSQIYSNIKA